MSNRTPGRTPALATPRRAPHAVAAERLSSPTGQETNVTIEVDPSEPTEHLFRRLLSAYLGGATVLTVVEVPRLTASSREVVREFVRRTSGGELSADTGRELRLTVSGPEPSSLDVPLRQLGERVIAFHREAVDSWTSLPLGADGRWVDRDDDIDREAWSLERAISRWGDRPDRVGSDLPAAWTIARSLERIGDHAVTLGEVGPRLAEIGTGAGPVRELRQFHAQALEHLEQALRAPEGTHANDLLDVGEALTASGRSLAERLLPAVGDGSMAPATAAAVARALEAVSRTVAYSQDIAQAYFDRARGPGTSRHSLGRLAAPAA